MQFRTPLGSFSFLLTWDPPSTVAFQTGHGPIFDIVTRPSALRAFGGWPFRGGNKTGTTTDSTGESFDCPATVAMCAASVRRLDLDYTFSSTNAASGELRHDPEGVFTLASTEGAGNAFHLLPGSLPAPTENAIITFNCDHEKPLIDYWIVQAVTPTRPVEPARSIFPLPPSGQTSPRLGAGHRVCFRPTERRCKYPRHSNAPAFLCQSLE